ncbi:MAG: twin-arginine translocase TatA/TatE family subunit [Alphaproteobacteria bacterium]|nr:twin-arginine translocase TatA/TatE family subunit [Alphaproteobacteria bacterium]
MGALSIWHILVVAVLVVLLFGRGKISELMGDVAKGIRSFRKGLSDEEPGEPARKSLPQEATPAEKPTANERTNA